MDIDRVRIGQPAEIRFAVFKDAYLVSGVLVKVSADRLVDPATEIPYYSAEITYWMKIFTYWRQPAGPRNARCTYKNR